MSYELLDSGHGRKLECVGSVLVERQAPAAVWSPRLPAQDWEQINGRHERSDKGGGRWIWLNEPRGSWHISFGELRLQIKPTPFGHLGVFAEQAEQWDWLRRAVTELKKESGEVPELLNLFAYTGGSTLAAAQSGARVTHVDAARGIVDWARQNASLNDLQDAPVRWIVEDCVRFLQREVKRGRRYDGVILDPPSFGRGTRGEVWKIDDDLLELLGLCRELVGEDPGIVLLSSHSPGYSALGLGNLLAEFFGGGMRALETGEMSIGHRDDARLLPSGTFARLARVAADSPKPPR